MPLIVGSFLNLFGNAGQNYRLELANTLVDWERSATDSPFSSMISDIVGHRTQSLDKREPDKVAAGGGAAYIRVYLKDMKLGYEGYPRRAPSKSEIRESHSHTSLPICLRPEQFLEYFAYEAH